MRPPAVKCHVSTRQRRPAVVDSIAIGELMRFDSSKRFSQRRLTFSDNAIRDEFGNDVMMDWEHPMMERHAALICREGACT